MNNSKSYNKIMMSFFVSFFVVSGFIPASSMKFAVIGDFGEPCEASQNVAKMVKSWDSEFIITTGDNNYPSGAQETIDESVGSLYSTYIYPYKGSYEPPSVLSNRFFPCLGNHDFDKKLAEPYLNYFTLPGNGYSYDFVKGDVHFFVLCSDERGPDGLSLESKQLTWLKEEVQQSKLPWKIVYFHHPAYSSEIMVPPAYKKNIYTKNRERRIDAPFAEWGISAVLNGHLHIYERFEIDKIPYVTNGLGGGQVLYEFCDEHPESLKRFTGEHGAMLVEANEIKISFKFVTVSGKIVDEFSLIK